MNALVAQGRSDFIIHKLVLIVHEPHGCLGDLCEHLCGRHVVGTGRRRADLDALHESGHPDLEELVEVRGRDAEELQALEQRQTAVLGLVQHTTIELELRQLAIDVVLRQTEIDRVHFT